MKLINIIKEESNNFGRHKLRGQFISEEIVSGKSIINVDIQPEYQNYQFLLL